MTVEAERTESRIFGLKKTKKTRVLDFRAWWERISPSVTIGSHPDLVVLKVGPILEDDNPNSEFVFAKPISEDDLEVRTTPSLFELGETVIYSKNEINQANLVSDAGERIRWRETQLGDYPPLRPGQELSPIQQSLKLV